MVKLKRKYRPQKDQDENQKKLTTWNRAINMLMLLFLSGLWLGAFFPEKRLWGINHWAYFPLWLRTLLIGLGILVFVPVINKGFRSFLERTVISAFRSLMENQKNLGYLFVVVVSLVLFYLFRTKIPLLGDGFQITQRLENASLSVNWSQPLAIWLYLNLFNLLKEVFHLDGPSTYALISYLSGAIFVTFALRMSMFLSKEWSTRLFVFLILILMGGTQLFLGYAEHYPLLYSGILIYLFYGLKNLRKESRTFVPLIIFILLLPLHFSSLYLLPSALFLLLSDKGGIDVRPFRGNKIWVALVFFLVISISMVLFIKKYSWYALDYLVPLLHGSYNGPGYTMFSVSHLLDFVNQQLLISPVGVALLFIFLIFKRTVPTKGDRPFQFLLIVSLSQLLFNFLINPGLGAARDWDLFASAGLGYTLLALYLFIRHIAEFKTNHLKLNLITVTFLFVLPWFLVNAHTDRSVARFRNLLDLDPRKSRNGHFVLAGYFDSVGETKEVDRENRKILEKLPEVELVQQAYRDLRLGKFEDAYAKMKEAIAVAPDFPEAYSALGMYYFNTGDIKNAEAMFKKTLDLQPDNRDAYVNLGDIYMKYGDFVKANALYDKAVRMGSVDPKVFNNLAILHAQRHDLEKAVSFYRKAIARKRDFAEAHYGLAFVYYRQGMYEESLSETNMLLKIEPDFNLGFHLLGSIYEALGRKQEAISAYQRYLQLQPDDPRADQIKQTIQNLKIR